MSKPRITVSATCPECDFTAPVFDLNAGASKGVSEPKTVDCPSCSETLELPRVAIMHKGAAPAPAPEPEAE